jgi:hypothetical protein
MSISCANGRRDGIDVQAGDLGDELRIGGDAAERAVVEVDLGGHPPTDAVQELLDETSCDRRDDPAVADLSPGSTDESRVSAAIRYLEADRQS